MYARARNQDLDNLSDSDLVQRFKAGDDGALEVLLKRHSEDLYRFCCHLVANREDAEDICQESLTRAIDKVESLQSGSAFRGWLFRIARNLCIDAFRHRRRTCTLLEDDATPAPLRVDGPQSTVESGEERQTVAQALSRLADSHQRVLVLREVEGLSYADISRRLNVSHSAVETLLFRARRRLREEYVRRDRGTSGIALLTGIREIVTRFAEPVVGGTHFAAQTAAAAALIGGTVLSYSGAIALQHARHAAQASTVHRQTFHTLRKESHARSSFTARAAAPRQIALNIPLRSTSRAAHYINGYLPLRPPVGQRFLQPLHRSGFGTVAMQHNLRIRSAHFPRLARNLHHRKRTAYSRHRKVIRFVTGLSREGIRSQNNSQPRPAVAFGRAASEQQRLPSFYRAAVYRGTTIRWAIPAPLSLSSPVVSVRSSFGPSQAVTTPSRPAPQVTLFRSSQSTPVQPISGVQTSHGSAQSLSIWQSPTSASRSINQPQKVPGSK